MTFSRVNASSWATGAEVTTAQINQLDLDHANALDKSIAGDGVFGPLTFTNNVTAGVSVSIVGQGTTTTASGGRIVLGDNDYPTRLTSAAITRCLPILMQLNAGTNYIVDANMSRSNVVGSAGATAISQGLIDGATLVSVTVYVTVTAHAGLPAIMPSFSVAAVALATGAMPLGSMPGTVNTLSAVTIVRPASPTAWFSNGQVQSFTLSIGATNIMTGPIGAVIDRTQFAYFLAIQEEAGANSVAGNLWQSVQLNMTNIVDMRRA